MLNDISESVYLLAMALIVLRNADLGAQKADRIVMVAISCFLAVAFALAFASKNAMPSLIGGAMILVLALVAALGGVPGLQLRAPTPGVVGRRVAELFAVFVLAVAINRVWRW